MTDERLGLDDLTDDEKLAFGALLRAMVSMDGVYTAEEKAVLKVLAVELGGDGFWAMLETAQSEVKEASQILKLAEGVTRPEVREFLYYGINATAQAGSVSDKEAALLRELRTMWQLKTSDDE